MDPEDYECQFCGKIAKHFAFAALVCDSSECMEKAKQERGGPGGHMKKKAQGLPIIPDDVNGGTRGSL
jgi:hypothetical protein